MRNFFLTVAALVAIVFLLFQVPATQPHMYALLEKVTGNVPDVAKLTEPPSRKEASDAALEQKDASSDGPQSKVVTGTAKDFDEQFDRVKTASDAVPPVETAEAKRKKFVGAWLSNDDVELIMLRDDGKARLSYTVDFEYTIENRDLKFYFTVHAVAYGTWSMGDGGQGLAFELDRLSEFDIRNANFRPLSIHKTYDSWEAAKITNEIQASATKEAKKDIEKEIRAEDDYGGRIVTIAENTMVLKYKDTKKPSSYRRLEPGEIREPKGNTRDFSVSKENF